MSYRRKKKKHSKFLVLFSFMLAIALSSYILMALSEEFHFKYIPVLSDVKTDLLGSGKLSDINNECEVHFIDVGQGDCIFVLCGGKTLLIDAGDNDKGKIVVDYLKKLGVRKIDMLIATHPHSDHIGGMDTVINTFTIGKIVMPYLPDNLVPTTRTYTDVLTAIACKGLKITPAKVGNSYDFGEGKLTILSPNAEYDELNNISVVCKFTYSGNSFLFTGDIEAPVERDLLISGVDLKSDVLKVAHHGSSTSTIKQFYEAVSPDKCIISVGDDNSYGHPSDKTLKTLSSNGAEIFRTDFQGSIVLGIKDGKITVSCEKGKSHDKICN